MMTLWNVERVNNTEYTLNQSNCNIATTIEIMPAIKIIISIAGVISIVVAIICFYFEMHS